jgi:TonB family protein
MRCIAIALFLMASNADAENPVEVAKPDSQGAVAGELADAKASQPRSSGAEARWARLTRVVDPYAYYPSDARYRKEEGSPVVQACVGATGKLLREPTVEETSGFPDLDRAAIKVAKASRYAAGKENGTPLAESCIKFKVRFALRK